MKVLVQLGGGTRLWRNVVGFQDINVVVNRRFTHIVSRWAKVEVWSFRAVWSRIIQIQWRQWRNCLCWWWWELQLSAWAFQCKGGVLKKLLMMDLIKFLIKILHPTFHVSFNTWCICDAHNHAQSQEKICVDIVSMSIWMQAYMVPNCLNWVCIQIIVGYMTCRAARIDNHNHGSTEGEAHWIIIKSCRD